MFKHIGRQLVILNALVVIAIIIMVGFATYFSLRRSLNQEIDQSLLDRIAGVQGVALTGSSPAAPVSVSDLEESDDDEDKDDEDEHEDDDDDDEDRRIVASGDTILLILDETGTIIQNPRAVELRDLPIAEGITAALDGKTDARSVTLSDGEHVRVMTVPTRDDGRIVGAVQAVRSLSEHEGQLELVRNMTLLGVGFGLLVAAPAGYYLARRAMMPINTAFDRQRAFAADASHELRTPLTLIRANADYGLSQPASDDPETQASFQNILVAVDRIDRQVDDLLLLARLDAGQLDFDFEDHDLSEVVREAVDSSLRIFEDADIGLSFGATTHPIARLDADRLQQVILGLLNNAYRHTQPGGKVEVQVAEDRNTATVTISDTGSGIPEDELPHVFERFYRVDKSRSRAAGGTGLGLAIARQIIDAHLGEISIASKAGEGTIITIRLPIVR